MMAMAKSCTCSKELLADLRSELDKANKKANDMQYKGIAKYLHRLDDNIQAVMCQNDEIIELLRYHIKGNMAK